MVDFSAQAVAPSMVKALGVPAFTMAMGMRGYHTIQLAALLNGLRGFR